MRFDNQRDASSYLSNTVCYYNGVPIYIEAIDANLMAHAYNLPYNGQVRLVDINSELFNCREYKLGYMNAADGCYYVSRRPSRGTAQGICDNNLSFIPSDNDRHHRGTNMARAVQDPGLVQMLTGIYPTIPEALQKLEHPNVNAVAISRHLCIKKHPQFNNLRFLEYKGQEISFSDTNAFDLPEDFQYLREICNPTGVLKVG